MRRPDDSRDWSPRRPGQAPAEMVRGLARQYAHGALLAELLWQRGVDDLEAAAAFLEPSLQRGLRPPAGEGTLDAFASAIAETGAGGVELVVGAGARLATGLVVAAMRSVLGRAVVAGGTASVLVLEADAWRLEAPAGRVVRTWRPRDADSGLPEGAGVAAAALYVLARLRRIRERAGLTAGADPRRALDVLALAVLAEADTVSMRHEHRTIVTVGLPALPRRSGMRMLLETAQAQERTAHAIRTRLVPRLEAVWSDGGGDALARVLEVDDAEQGQQVGAWVEMVFARRRAAEPALGAWPAETAVVAYDVGLPLAGIGPGLALALARLEPHGIDNPEPVFLARAVRIDGARLAGDPMRPYQRLRLRQQGRTVRAVCAAGTLAEGPSDQCFDALYGVRAVPAGVETRVLSLAPDAAQAAENANKTTVS